jgi:hypothetical protein
MLERALRRAESKMAWLPMEKGFGWFDAGVRTEIIGWVLRLVTVDRQCGWVSRHMAQHEEV